MAWDIFMSEMHLRQPGFAYWACAPLIKNKQRVQKFMKAGDTCYNYLDNLDKACFQHDMT